MKVHKITVGYVVQTYDMDQERCISQEFMAGDQVMWEDDYGIAIDEDWVVDGIEKLPYQNFEMVQPR